MKKTLITLLALAGVAAADTITLTPMTTTEGWVFGKARNKGSNTELDTTNGTMTSTNVGWAGAYAEYSLSEAITLQSPEDTMTVSFTMLSSKATGPYSGNNWGVCMTTTLIGGNTALTAGYGRYDQSISDSKGPIQMVASSNTNYHFFNMKETVGGDAPLTGYTEATGVLQNNVALTLTNTIKWDASISQFVSTITYGENNTVLGTANLGETFSLEKINLSVDTGSLDNSLNAQISGLTITANLVPEPTTATLSLLALCGLAARRRRK